MANVSSLFIQSPALTARQPLTKRDIIKPLPGSADIIESKFQPLLDFDSDGCYNTAAISPDGKTYPGHDATGSPQGGCRDPPQLQNSNTYSRMRCNNDYCAIMYEYYFGKDQAVMGSFLGGHRHDWENMQVHPKLVIGVNTNPSHSIVFIKGDQVIRVAPSCHGYYGGASNSFPKDGTRPQLVYHKDGAGTHCFRFAKKDDIAHPENPFQKFYTSPLVGWNSWPSLSLRHKMLLTWNGGIGPKLDTEFSACLREAVGSSLPSFNPELDS